VRVQRRTELEGLCFGVHPVGGINVLLGTPSGRNFRLVWRPRAGLAYCWEHPVGEIHDILRAPSAMDSCFVRRTRRERLVFCWEQPVGGICISLERIVGWMSTMTCSLAAMPRAMQYFDFVRGKQKRGIHAGSGLRLREAQVCRGIWKRDVRTAQPLRSGKSALNEKIKIM
jgi:hypothetical protein